MKVPEKATNRQLTKHLELNNLLDPSKSGFRANHSTETALIAATDDIRTVLDRGEMAALILLVLSEAFNTISHHTLSNRLHQTGIQGEVLKRIASYLTERTQRILLPP